MAIVSRQITGRRIGEAIKVVIDLVLRDETGDPLLDENGNEITAE